MEHSIQNQTAISIASVMMHAHSDHSCQMSNFQEKSNVLDHSTATNVSSKA